MLIPLSLFDAISEEKLLLPEWLPIE